MQKIKRNIISWDFLIVFSLIIFSFLLRFKGLTDSHPFWTDEFSTANQAILLQRFGLSFFTQQQYYVEITKFIPTALVATAFNFFGREEWVARLPFVIIGSLIPGTIYYIFKNWTSKTVAVGGAILSATSYFMITWSRQARGYVLLQIEVLVFLALYISFIRNRQRNTLIALAVVTLLGMFTHPFFFIAILAVFLHAFILARSIITKYITFKHIGVLTGLLLILAFIMRLPYQLVTTIQTNAISINDNLWYYHSFLWREYMLITFIGGVGLLIASYKHIRLFSLLLIYITLHMTFVLFLFDPYVVRYLLPIWPFLLIGAAYSLWYFVRLFLIHEDILFQRLLSALIPILIIGGVISNGDDFLIKPQAFYSVNHDFREIAIVDYHEVYSIIQDKGDLTAGNTAVIDTWADRLEWYLGMDYEAAYFFRWEDAGLMKQTPFVVNTNGEKVIPQRNNMKFIGNLEDLQGVMAKYPKGFIYIDDTTLPRDVLDYVEANLTKELSIDHYHLDDNPYSIWPATLYSWGVQ